MKYMITKGFVNPNNSTIGQHIGGVTDRVLFFNNEDLYTRENFEVLVSRFEPL